MGSNPTPGTDTRVAAEGRRGPRRELPTVPAELIALPPVAFALWSLAAAAGLPERWSLRERAGMVLGAAVVLGPLALAALGLFGWLLMIAALTAVITAYAFARRDGRRPRRPSGSGPWALPRP